MAHWSTRRANSFLVFSLHRVHSAKFVQNRGRQSLLFKQRQTGVLGVEVSGEARVRHASRGKRGPDAEAAY